MTEQLKNCPFCGSRPVGIVENKKEWWVGCKTCLQSIVEKPTKQEAIEAWNTRARGTCRDCKHRNGHHNDCDFLANTARNVDIFDLYFDLPDDFYCAKWEAKEQPNEIDEW